MAYRKLSEYKCDICGTKAVVPYDADPPDNWSVIDVAVSPLQEKESRVYCSEHTQVIAKAMGFQDLETLVAVIRITEEAKAEELKKQVIQAIRDQHGDVVMGDDEIYIFDDPEEN